MRRHCYRTLRAAGASGIGVSAEEREHYAGLLVGAERQPLSWQQREPAFDAADRFVGAMRDFDRRCCGPVSGSAVGQVLPVADLVRVAKAAFGGVASLDILVTQQFIAWCRYTDRLTVDERITLAQAALRRARPLGGHLLRAARLALATSLFYGGRSAELVEPLRAAIAATPPTRRLALVGFYPRSLLVEALLSLERLEEAKAEARTLLRDTLRGLPWMHPFVGHVEELAYDRLGVGTPK